MEKIKLLLVLLSIVSVSFAQNSNTVIIGKVLDESKTPIRGANVFIDGSTLSVKTDVDGRFLIEYTKSFPVTIYVESEKYQEYKLICENANQEFIVTLQSKTKNVEEVKVTARRRKESVQDIPIATTVVGGAAISESGSFNVNRVKELVPTVQLYSSNPRNTTLNIRGLGSTFGLTNDGIDPGVGYYVDGVYYARPAATALDFIDIEQIEVLRGPQGTLFGKNTTAGAFNITSKAPSFNTGVNFETSFGNFGFVQAKTSITGKLIAKKLAGRLSFSGTQRNGTIYNVATDEKVNDMNNIGVRGQLLYLPTSRIKVLLIADYTQQNPNGYAQVYAGKTTTLRAEYRQFDNIIRDLNYSLPSENPFDRKIDHDTPWRSENILGGVSANIDVKIGKGTLTSTTAWRFWDWGPSNDRDFTGLPVLTKSQAPSKHQQTSQEIRYAGDITKWLSGVVGVFAIEQELKSSPYHTEESGAAQWRFAQNSNSILWQTPGLFEGYGIRTYSKLTSFSGAVFANLDWKINKRISLLTGIRANNDKKNVNYRRETYGGLDTQDANLIKLKKVVYSDQAFDAKVDNTNYSGQATLSYKLPKYANFYAVYSSSFKPVGVNLGGLPTNNGEVMLELATIKPETVSHYEFGIKSTPLKNTIINLSFFNTDVKDYQTLVQTAQLGVNRGYLSNAEKVNVKGFEVDARIKLFDHLNLNASYAYTEGRYVKFTNAPVPLEETGGPVSFKDISGERLPGISKNAGSFGLEFFNDVTSILNQGGQTFFGIDCFFRSSFSSSPTPSAHLNINSYSLINSRIGFRTSKGVSFTFWVRNLENKNYFEQLLPGAGNHGHYAAVLGDPRTYGMTLKYSF
jgi:iron complex outermembrane recepter protein